MIGSTRTLRVWAYPEPADLRAGSDGLSAPVTGKGGAMLLRWVGAGIVHASVGF